MKVHVLTGDSIGKPVMQTGIEGEVIVSRECLIAGEVGQYLAGVLAQDTHHMYQE